MRQVLFGRLGIAVAVAAVSAVVYSTLGSAAITAAPGSSSPPAVSGTPQQGNTLSATSGSWTGTTPITFTYQWTRCNSSGAACAAIAGATSQTYLVQAADVGQTLRVNVTATNADGSAQATSAPTDVVVAAAANAPENTKAPELTGTLTQGQTLTVTPGTWTGATPITYTYEWQRCNAQGLNCAAFSSGTATTYTLAAADTGNRIQVRVIAKNSAGETSKYSNQTGQVGSSATAPANTAAPQLTGTLAVGQTLSVTSGTWSGTAPITYTYEWQRCNAQGTGCAAIGGATAQTYKLTTSDSGARLQVLVTAKNAGGTTAKYSSQTAVVGGTPAPAGSVAASTVNLPDRLIVDKIQYPEGGRSRAPFTARFHVSDTAKHSVSGALVYVVGLPYGWIRTIPEQATDASGWATLTLNPTLKMPRSTALVMFVRARTPQGDPLAGASTRRLVQVKVRP
ncbi:MAG: hypothetical protein ACXVRD_08535 [Gaiellaceae bacterium]